MTYTAQQIALLLEGEIEGNPNAEITKIRKDLTVKPFVNGSFGVEASPFAIYMEILL